MSYRYDFFRTLRTPVRLSDVTGNLFDLHQKAGEGIRTPDVQLGKLAFYH
jgi:hypothetical protein